MPDKGTTKRKSVVSYEVPAVFVVNGHFDESSSEIKEQIIPWEGYHNAGLISEQELNGIMEIKQRKFKINNKIKETVVLLLELAQKINRTEAVQQIIIVLQELIEENDEGCVAALKYQNKNGDNVYKVMERIMSNKEEFIALKGSMIVVRLMNYESKTDKTKKLEFARVYRYLEEMMGSGIKWVIDVAIQIVQSTLELPGAREALYYESGQIVKEMVEILKSTVTNTIGGHVTTSQVQYEIGYCLWMMSFNKTISERMERDYEVITTLLKISRGAMKEKVIRIAVGILRNLVELGGDHNYPVMVVCGVRGCLEALQGRKYSDSDLTTDISELVGVLDEQANRINEGEREEGSWALYVNQVKSGILTMGQTQHYDDKFWKSNAKRMEEKDGYVIRKLVEHLMSIKNTETEQEKLAIICHDIGMYLKYSHNSMQAKKLLDGLGAKKKIMELLLESNDNNATGGSGSGSSAGSGKYQQMVRYEALNTIHYFMMNAWENSSVNLTTNTGSVNAS